MEVIALDIDGVLNDHTQQENKYCGTKKSCVSHLNRVLDAFPDVKILISSAWRYMMLRGDVTLHGFEMLLLTHGVKCHERLVGHTEADGPIEDEPHHHDEPEKWRQAGLSQRAGQIYRWAMANDAKVLVAIDDLPLRMPELYRTNSETGLTAEDADQIIVSMAARKPKYATPSIPKE